MAEKRPLRVFFGPHDAQYSECHQPPEPSAGVSIPLAELLHSCGDAVQNDRAWVHDFQDEMITISTDLYEVILAYQHYRRKSA